LVVPEVAVWRPALRAQVFSTLAAVEVLIDLELLLLVVLLLVVLVAFLPLVLTVWPTGVPVAAEAVMTAQPVTVVPVPLVL
jgi:hypothetical protein